MTEQQQRAAGRAGSRLALGLAGALVVLVAAVPLAILLRADNPGLVQADRAVTGAAERAVQANQALLLAARAVTLLGEPVLVTAGAALLAVLLWRAGRPRLALFVLAARVGAIALSQGLKLAVDRARPVFDQPVATALGASFPSGHALGSAAFYGTAAVLLLPYVRRAWLLAVAVLAVSLPVAASRVLLGVHYVSDVTAGLLIGLGWAALCTAVFAAWRAEEGRPVEVVEEGIGRR